LGCSLGSRLVAVARLVSEGKGEVSSMVGLQSPDSFAHLEVYPGSVGLLRNLQRPLVRPRSNTVPQVPSMMIRRSRFVCSRNVLDRTGLDLLCTCTICISVVAPPTLNSSVSSESVTLCFEDFCSTTMKSLSHDVVSHDVSGNRDE
jgi:hypothetical protein